MSASQASRLPAASLERVREDHGLTQAAWETERRNQLDPLGGFTMWSRGYRGGWWDAVSWLLTAQQQIDDLTVGQLLAELRKGPGSIYWPVKSGDPRFWGDCPRCHRPVLIDAQGLCPECAHEFDEE